MATLKMILHFQAMHYSKTIEENNSLKERLTAIEALLYKILEEKTDKLEEEEEEDDEDEDAEEEEDEDAEEEEADEEEEEDDEEEDEAQEAEDKVGSE